jgi:hypothetical protein
VGLDDAFDDREAESDASLIRSDPRRAPLKRLDEHGNHFR